MRRDEVTRDLRESSRAFLDLVWPRIARVCGGGSIRPVEVLDDCRIAGELDRLAGIDVWQTSDGVRGIASRVQFCDRSFDTFTIRAERSSGMKTEYEKRLEAIETGRWIFPYLTVQAYVGTDKAAVLSAAVVKTEDLHLHVKERAEFYEANARKSIDPDGSWALFYWVRWSDLKRCGVRVRVFRNEELKAA